MPRPNECAPGLTVLRTMLAPGNVEWVGARGAMRKKPWWRGMKWDPSFTPEGSESHPS